MTKYHVLLEKTDGLLPTKEIKIGFTSESLEEALKKTKNAIKIFRSDYEYRITINKLTSKD